MPYASSQKRRDKRRDERVVIRHAKMYEALAALVRWSADGEYSHASDVLPGLGNNEITRRLGDLIRNGYAESETFKDCCHRERWWRATDAGRHAYELHVFASELRRGLGLLGGGLAVGGPDRRVGSRAIREALEMEKAA